MSQLVKATCLKLLLLNMLLLSACASGNFPSTSGALMSTSYPSQIKNAQPGPSSRVSLSAFADWPMYKSKPGDLCVELNLNSFPDTGLQPKVQSELYLNRQAVKSSAIVMFIQEFKPIGEILCWAQLLTPGTYEARIRFWLPSLPAHEYEWSFQVSLWLS
jgi:hypothetical protein